MEMEIVTLAATPAAITAIMNKLRDLGLPAKHALWLAAILGMTLALTDYFLGGYSWYSVAISGLMMGLAAAGLHDLAGRAGGNGYVPKHALPEDLDKVVNI